MMKEKATTTLWALLALALMVLTGCIEGSFNDATETGADSEFIEQTNIAGGDVISPDPGNCEAKDESNANCGDGTQTGSTSDETIDNSDQSTGAGE